MSVEEIIKNLELIPITEEIRFKIYCDIGKVIENKYIYVNKELSCIFCMEYLEKLSEGKVELPLMYYQYNNLN